MKKITGILIILCMLFVTSCGSDYPAVESTKEEAEVLFTIDVGNKSYNVKYELYRAFFLTYKGEVDGGDTAVWSGSEKAEYVQRINEIILPKIANIYATINLAEKIGVDFTSGDVKDKVEELIEISVEGGTYNGVDVSGYGDYDKYLAALKSMNLNYSVQVLLYHYAIAQSEIAEYYIGTLNEDNFTPDATKGHLEYTRDDVKAFYDSDECVRVLRAFVQDSIEAEERASNIREQMRDADSTSAVSIIIIQNTFMSESEAFGGMIIGKNSLDSNNYAKMTEAAFALDVGQVSDVLKIMTGDENGYHILYRAEKSNSHFDEYYVEIVDSYLNQKIGEMINEGAEDLLFDIDYKDTYNNIDYSAISMD